MFYGNTINDTRRFFFSSWEKYNKKESLLPLEKQIVAVILDHPEYHTLLEKQSEMHQAYFPETGLTNPFLHMGLHLAIRDQIATDRPAGIKSIFKRLVSKPMDSLSVEHLLMERLAECLWHAQREQKIPDDSAYLKACKDLLL